MRLFEEKKNTFFVLCSSFSFHCWESCLLNNSLIKVLCYSELSSVSYHLITSHGQKDFPTWKSTSMIATVTCKLPRVLLVSSRVPVVVKFIKNENRHTVFKAQECVKRGVWWCMLVWSNVLSAHGDQGWHQCWVTGQCLRLKLWQITVSESYRRETCLKQARENHMLPWLLETCFPCLLC